MLPRPPTTALPHQRLGSASMLQHGCLPSAVPLLPKDPTKETPSWHAWHHIILSIYLRCHLAVTLQEATQHRRPIELQKRFVFARRPLFFLLLLRYSLPLLA